MHELLTVHKQRIPTVDTVIYDPSIPSHTCKCSSHTVSHMCALLCYCESFGLCRSCMMTLKRR